jgi:hypothetical protein
MKEVMANPESDTVSRPVAISDNISHGSITQDIIKVGSKNQSTFVAATEHKGSPKAAMSLDPLDGPTVIAEVCQLLRVRTSTVSQGC